MSNQAKILIVDDETINLDLFDVMFSKLGFIVEKASDGIEGLEKAKRFFPDIILLDNIMPRMSGWELTRILKSDAKYKDIPIVMLSALDDVRDKLAGFELGIDDYITKPFNFSEVLARIRVLLRNRELYTQVLLRDSRLSLAEELSEDLRQDLSDFMKAVADLDAAVAAMRSKSASEQKDQAKLLLAVSEKSRQARECAAGINARIQETSAEWERLKKNEIGLPQIGFSQMEAEIYDNPLQE